MTSPSNSRRGAIRVDVLDEQESLLVDAERLRRAVAMIVSDAGRGAAAISVAIVDDPTIQRLHQRFLQLDSPTDVLSFVLEDGPHGLEGEIIASAETARATAPRFGWSAEDELLLYVVHGALHLVGFDDLTPEPRAEMRRQEHHYLERLGVVPPDMDPDDSAAAIDAPPSPTIRR